MEDRCIACLLSEAPTDRTAFSMSEVRPDAAKPAGPPRIIAPPRMVASADGAHVSSGAVQAIAALTLWRELLFAAAVDLPAAASSADVTTGWWRA